MYYILNEKREPVHEPDVVKWGQWMESHVRHIAKDLIHDVHISTVFLGLDHNFYGKGSPILFETMIFGGRHDEYQRRYHTWQEAEAGHARAVYLVNETMPA